jgi:hypothetical protein
MDEQEILYYSCVAFFIAAKFNEIQWPDLKDIFGKSFSLKSYLVKENEILESVNYSIPYPNHFFYLETLIVLLGIS